MSSEPGWSAQIDQALAGFKDAARLAWGYFSELREQGFTDEAALRIVIAWQNDTLNGGSSEDR